MISEQQTQHWQYFPAEETKEAMKVSAAVLRRLIIYRWKLGKCCVDCGESDITKLQCDHVDPNIKVNPVGQIQLKHLHDELAKCAPRCIPCHRHRTKKQGERHVKRADDYQHDASVYAEPGQKQKCRGDGCRGRHVPVRLFKGGGAGRCQACHRRAVLKRRESKRQLVRRAKQGRGSCARCGLAVKEKNEYLFDFDHVNPKTKRRCVSRMVNDLFGDKAILAEIGKCDLLCCVCHDARTAKQLGWRNYAFRTWTAEQMDEAIQASMKDTWQRKMVQAVLEHGPESAARLMRKTPRSIKRMFRQAASEEQLLVYEGNARTYARNRRVLKQRFLNATDQEIAAVVRAAFVDSASVVSRVSMHFGVSKNDVNRRLKTIDMQHEETEFL